MSSTTEMRYVNAVTQALRDSMEQDPSVVVMGEDVANAGGSFKATRGLLDTFGAQRVIDTPISESAIASAAVGMALTGLKPVVEIMFMDFITLSMDALVNQAAKARYMFGGQGSVPMVLRTPHGGGLSAGPQHSQCLEAWLAHIPGLKVVCPSSPQDAYSLLRAAIADPDPVMFIEHKAMYAAKGPVDTAQAARIGTARTARAGRDATLVTYGATVSTCLQAAEQLAKDGVEVEVIDLRSIQPWDKAAVLESLSRTHRAVVVHEAVQSFGVGAEIVATIADEGFDELDAPVLRVAAPFMPAPFASSLEKGYVVTVERVIDAVRKTLA
ncbi:pyruvate dehydrogenase E1 component subunit beta [Alicycliphilus denitrificans]|uniref:alpha-ketoacid dehydrogenase subunit beta n=1 Tax=Alicycliphilus denitrificans TaxID=179636 RepID=UPI000960BC7F|nr:alpha-ketoacid dehydrogenase subunit beta [Alicycliphilus denitrificans]MBN9573895.1 alpha-ketoacid dehydrogenase subunit beta [Alicycliphilus denitrificans]OJW87015.1 MAG: alpha-ketoacid dehydrogenase subunit beta [Alicycliphilus sp. 69-12]BCN39087.1 pyruvate dehydrogenase E1 component subunit beta [Alicycliphilus denitrificans]